jgi:hypothetical protein
MPHMSSHLYGHYSAQVTPQPPASDKSPWWMWVAGGTLAIGLGIAGAVWYAKRGELATPPAPQVAQPAPQLAQPVPPAPAAPQLVELRFDSLPKAGVYVEGHSAELCRTPCTFNVNLADGGPTDRRMFVVRADGYRDKSVIVDLHSVQRDYGVTLDQMETAGTSTSASDKPADDDHPKVQHPGRPPKHTVKADKKPPIDKPPIDKPPVDKPPIEKPADPVEKKPKPTGSIDPSDTVDPFQK